MNCPNIPAVQAVETIVGHHKYELGFNLGDIIAVTYFNKSEPYWSGILVDEKYASAWWEFEKLPYEDAISRPHGRFPSHAVCLL